MPVLVEGISVVVRLDAIGRLMESDWSKFVEVVPNQTLCCDNELARVGFMNPQDAEAFVEVLEGLGFRFLDESRVAQDLIVMDQLHGPFEECEWLEWGTVRMNEAGEKVTVCRLKGGREQKFFAPDGWRFEGSLSQQFDFKEEGDPSERYRHVRTEGGVDVYYDSATGREVYSGRTRA